MIKVHDERGSGLILALVMLSVVGLLITAVLGFGFSSIMTAETIRDQGKRIYAADAGIERAIQAIRYADLEIGRDPLEGGSCPPIDLAGVNGKTASVTCVGQPGSGSSAAGPSSPRSAILTLGTNTTEGSVTLVGSEDLRVRGAIRTNSRVQAQNANARVRVKGPVWSPFLCQPPDGPVLVEAPDPGDPIPNVNCRSNVPPFPTPIYTPDDALPPLPALPPIPLCASVVTLSPGTYTNSAILNRYTRPGGNSSCDALTLLHLQTDPDPTKPSVYYFDFQDDPVWSINRPNLRIIGGTLQINPLTAQPMAFPDGCRTGNGVRGVQLVFAGASRIVASDGTTELCPTGHTGRQRVSIFQYPSSGGIGIARPTGCVVAQPYGGSASGNAPCAVLTVTGNETQFFSHGTVYAPSAAVDVSANLRSSQVLGRGVVSRTLRIQGRPNCQGPLCGGDLIAAPDGGWADRTVEFLATVDSGVRIRAVVLFEDAGGDIPGERIRILSWSVRR